jgi:broad specificity phosphatase PhoE
MGKIYVVRHGQDTDNVKRILNGHRDTKLSSLGHEQAKAATKKFTGKKIAAIYCSPLRRAQQTALYIMCEVMREFIIIDSDLIERDFGKLTGASMNDKATLATKVFVCEKGVFVLEGPGVETFTQVFARAKGFLEYAKWAHPDEDIVIVTHGDTGKMLQAAHFGWTVDEALAKPYLQNAEVFELI